MPRQSGTNLTIQIPWWQIAIVLFMSLLYVANAQSPWALEFWANEQRDYYYAFWSSVFVIWVVTTLLAVHFMQRAGVSKQDIGFYWDWRTSIWAVAALTTLGLAAVVFREVVPYEMVDNSGIQRGGPTNALERLFWIPVFLGAGVFEELIFRGFAIPALKGKGLPTWMAVLVSTASFCLITGGTDWIGVAVTFFIGLVFSAIYLWRQNLGVVMVFHALVDWSLLVTP